MVFVYFNLLWLFLKIFFLFLFYLKSLYFYSTLLSLLMSRTHPVYLLNLTYKQVS